MDKIAANDRVGLFGHLRQRHSVAREDLRYDMVGFAVFRLEGNGVLDCLVGDVLRPEDEVKAPPVIV